MPITKFPNGISSFGVPVLGGGSIVTTGTIFFVDSATGNNVNDGLDPDHPVATIDYAMGLCTANKGDYIVCMPNHTENMTAAGSITCDVEGVTVLGLGKGNNRPELVWTSSSAADIEIDSDSVTFENIVFKTGSSTAGSTGAPVACIDVDDNNFSLINCRINNTGAAAALTLVHLDTNADDFKMISSEIVGSSAGCANAIDIGHDLTGMEVANCYFNGDFSEACIWSTASAATEINIHHNFMRNDNAGDACIDIGSSTADNEGIIAYNCYDVADTDGYAKVGLRIAKVAAFENYVTVGAVATQSGVLHPAAYGT